MLKKKKVPYFEIHSGKYTPVYIKNQIQVHPWSFQNVFVTVEAQTYFELKVLRYIQVICSHWNCNFSDKTNSKWSE